MWNQQDRNNLESIAKSLEKLVEREQERSLVEHEIPLFKRVKEHLKKEQIKVTEGISNEDLAIEEEIKVTQNIQNKLREAERTGNTPFFAEALLDEEELETL